jgi:hypothetical protein
MNLLKNLKNYESELIESDIFKQKPNKNTEKNKIQIKCSK